MGHIWGFEPTSQLIVILLMFFFCIFIVLLREKVNLFDFYLLTTIVYAFLLFARERPVALNSVPCCDHFAGKVYAVRRAVRNRPLIAIYC